MKILGSYVDDIDRSMKLFADGHFDAQPKELRRDYKRGDLDRPIQQFNEGIEQINDVEHQKGNQNVSSR